MKPFRFQQFEIQQNEKVFRVGTDAVLLGSLCDIQYKKKILEVGTGTGIISLMLAQRNPNAEILALDIDENAMLLTQENFQNSKFQNRLQVIREDYKNFASEILFDGIVSNPPYFELNDSHKDKLARQTIALNFEQLIAKSKLLLSESGVFSVIIPSDFAAEFEKLALEKQFYLKRKIDIYGVENGVLKRNILEFSLQEIEPIIQQFIIEKSPRKYSDQYLEVTKNFHFFG